MKNRLFGIWLFIFLGFLVWLYFATSPSSVDSWWSAMKEKPLEQPDGMIQLLPSIIVVSPMRVFVGVGVFMAFGMLLSFLTIKGKRGTND